MKPRLTAALIVSVGALLAGGAHAAAPIKTANGMLVDTNGMTLYTFDNDTAGKSTCNGGCASAWPPVVAASGAKAEGDLSLITRDDGSQQWAYKGKPLYLFKSDTKAGEMKGDNFKSVWHVVKP